MPFFPTHIEQVKLRKFHRPPFNTNEIPTGIQIQINSCSKDSFQTHAVISLADLYQSFQAVTLPALF